MQYWELHPTTAPLIMPRSCSLRIKQLCEDKQISLAQIDAVTVVNGPGSYTGLRVGLSAAKGICYAMKQAFDLHQHA